MTIQSGHISIMFAATHLEFILPHRPTKSPIRIPSTGNFDPVKGSLSRAYPVSETASFDDLLRTIDEADTLLNGRTRGLRELAD